ncbi:hypothetical protein DFH06DRAFT_1363281 [Mycena polygramma]|nr:hypothetical protein DFH06DRAFT_1363281 [Mycena polygramma]
MQHDKIAIVGIAAQLPSGEFSTEDLNYSSFWDFLLKRGQAYTPLTDVVFDSIQFESNMAFPQRGAFLKNATDFDNIAFGISTRDARAMPLSARRLMELSIHALADSGIESRGQRIGCFMSGNIALQGRGPLNTDGNLTGPSLQLDTACSSSLTALHLAITAIQRGDCSAALVGAAQIDRDLSEWTTYVQGGVLSQDGKCKPFTDAADGFGRGEGAIVIVVKALEAAVKDEDHIYSVVLGSAINSTGSRMPLNVPSALAQQQCVIEAYNRAGRHPTEVDYVELHATGTAVGDPIETNGAGALFFRKDTETIAGSVKANIGHLEVAAFLASLVKACLILEHGIIPPAVLASPLSPSIDWEKYQLAVPPEATALGCNSPTGRPLISLSGSGIGGATGHVLLEAPPTPEKRSASTSTAPALFLIGGLSPKAVEEISRTASRLVTDDPTSIYPLAVTLSRRARQMPWRTYFTSPSARAETPAAVLIPNSAPSFAFVFSGQGPQHFEMGRQLFAEYPLFRTTVLQLDDVYRRVMGVSLIESTGLFSHTPRPSISLPTFGWPVTITVSAIAMIQIALVDLLKSVGVIPNIMIGHSAGETAILYTSGAGPKEMAMEIAIERGKAMACTESADVGMASLACNIDHAREIIAEALKQHDGVLEISCLNAPDSISVSGTATLLDILVALAQARGFFAQRIRTMVPGHSSFMDPIKADYLARMSAVFERYPGSHIPAIPVLSTCRDGTFVDVFTPEYFWDNCRNSVQFSKAVSNIAVDSHIFLEVSCHAVLSSSVEAHGVPETRILCPMRRVSSTKSLSTSSNEPVFFSHTLGRLSLLGCNTLDLSGLYGASSFKPLSIQHPLTPRTISPPQAYLTNTPVSTNGPLSSSNLKLGHTTQPDLAQHVVYGESILPATAFIELLLESGANFLWDVEFVSVLSLSGANPLDVKLDMMDSSWAIKSKSGALPYQENARGCSDSADPPALPASLDLESIWKRLPPLDFNGFYESLSQSVTFGPKFQRIIRCHGRANEVIAEIRGPSSKEASEGYTLHPIILDACLHVLLHSSISKEFYLPSKLDHFTFYRPNLNADNWFSHILLRQWMPESKVFDILVTDSSGNPICEFQNLTVRKLSPAPQRPIERRFELKFQPVKMGLPIPPLASTFPQPPYKRQAKIMFEMLDALAVGMISRSLDQNVTIGSDASRARYLQFSENAVKNHTTSESLEQTAALELQTLWAPYFEVTDRISGRAIDTLYSDDLMAKFYSANNQTTLVCGEATNAFSGLLRSFRESGKRSIRILEVGAGTGLLTKYLAEELNRNPDILVEYTVTDISFALAADLASTIDYNTVIPKSYDLSKPPDAQGFHSETYDIIVALHVLHTVPDVKSCLSALNSLLIPGGSMLVVELDGSSWATKAGSVWFDCIFGVFPEWFGYDDGRTHCALDPPTWKDLVQQSGFVRVHTCVEAGATGREFFFTAQKSLTSSVAPALEPQHRMETIAYRSGQEILLQQYLLSLDAKVPATLYLLAMHGPDGDAALGLCAAIAKELRPWEIRLAIFESASHFSDPVRFITKHSSIFASGDNVVFFSCDGDVHVPRVVLATPPASLPEPDTQNLCCDIDPHHVNVDILDWSAVSASFGGFVGRVLGHHLGFEAAQLVTGLTEVSGTGPLRVPVGHISAVEKVTPDLAAESAAIVLSHLFSSHLPAQGKIAVAIEDQRVVRALEGCLAGQSSIQLVLPMFRDPRYPQRFRILLTDSETLAQYPHLRRWIPRDGKLILWDSLLRDAISEDPGWIRNVLAVGLAPALELVPRGHQVVPNGHPTGFPSLAECIPHACLPLRGDRSYILLGGIGGLGIDLAVWLYEHGARRLILTSRRGFASLDPLKDALTLAKVAYLQQQDDLVLRLEQCDATDTDAMQGFVRGVQEPIAGCFQMTLVLSDALFLKQTEQSMRAVYDSKIKVFEVFAAQVDIESLDFFVAFSSISGLVGVIGQSLYASACTALDGALARYSNAFSLITPGIEDAGYVDRTITNGAERGLVSMSAQSLWLCLEDGLRKLHHERSSRYIPDVDWNYLDFHFTLPASCRHLIAPSSNPSAHKFQRKNKDAILAPVLDLLEISLEDFDADQPLTTYGLDSISAAKLSSILSPYTSISQISLLGGISWTQIVAATSDRGSTDGGQSPQSLKNAVSLALDILLGILGISSDELSPDIPLSLYGLDSLSASRLANALEPYVAVTQMQLMGQTTWAQLSALMAQSRDSPNASAAREVWIEICRGPGVPLIILPGGDGSVAPFFALQTQYDGPLCAIQLADTIQNSESFAALVSFCEQTIRGKIPHGPYRLAAYSASNILGVALVQRLEAAGERVQRLIFIDYFPAIWTAPPLEALVRDGQLAAIQEGQTQNVLDMLANDPLIHAEDIEDYRAAVRGLRDASPNSMSAVKTSGALMRLLIDFMGSFYPQGQPRSHVLFVDAVLEWLATVKAPMSVLVAEHGIVKSFPGQPWRDLGAGRCRKPVNVTEIPGAGHYGIFRDISVARILGESES